MNSYDIIIIIILAAIIGIAIYFTFFRKRKSGCHSGICDGCSNSKCAYMIDGSKQEVGRKKQFH